MTGWINHRQVEAFHVVMLTGSMTSAGELLGISQPAVSRLIRDLEASVGFKLFQRHGNKIKPTPDAIILHREVDRSIQALSRIERVAESIAQQQMDTLRVTATPGISTVYIGKTVELLTPEYPDIVFNIHTGASAAVVDNLLTQQFDLGIAFFPNDIKGLEIEPLDRIEAVCILPRGHPLSDKSEINVTDLAGVPLVCQAKETQIQYQVLSVFRAANIDPMIKIETNVALTIYKLVESGAGVAIVEPITAKVMGDRPIVIKPFRPAIAFNPGIAYPTHLPRTRVAELFAAHVKQLFHDDFSTVNC